jgi:hypothetical protein
MSRFDFLGYISHVYARQDCSDVFSTGLTIAALPPGKRTGVDSKDAGKFLLGKAA